MSEDNSITPDILIQEKAEFTKILTDQGMTVIPADNRLVPENFNLDSIADPKNKRKVESAIRQYKTFLGMPIIIDNFERHEDREKWRLNMADELGPEKGQRFNDFFISNKLKRGSFGALITYSDFFKKGGVIDDSATWKLVELIKMTQEAEDGSDPWDNPQVFSTERKIATLKEISD